MAQTFQARRWSDDDYIDYTNDTGVLIPAGAVIVRGGMLGITRAPIPAGSSQGLAVEGVFVMVKEAGAINDGDVLYWHATGSPQGGTPSSGAINTTSSGGVFAGFAVGGALAAAETVVVWKQMAPIGTVTITTPLRNLIADPGTAGAIPVTDTGHVELVVAAGETETRTLADPTFLGQELVISAKTVGAAGTVAISLTAGHVFDASHDKVTMNAVQQNIALVAVANGTNKRWALLVNNGGTLGTQ